tara:strand:- start:8337 stop:8807 length:471 start_codon:yes stop_codon:yes gene_type:complete
MDSIKNLNIKLKSITGYTVSEIFEGEITIYSPFENSYIDYKNFKKPKNKKIDLQWLINKCQYVGVKNNEINCKEEFKKLQKIILKNLSKKSNVTSYGLGFEIMFTNHKEIHAEKDIICSYLFDLGIKNDFDISDASWVLRIKISKSKENLEKIRNL